MYIKFHADDIEFEVGDFNGTYEIGPIIENTVRGIKEILPEIKEIYKLGESLDEPEEAENPKYPVGYHV